MIESPTRRSDTPAQGASTPLEVDVAVVGAGFSGLGVAIALKKAGNQSFVVLERAGDVGGTWRDNQYPGCACDIPARLYSYSFDRAKSWSRIYPQQPELFAYLRRIVDKYGLRAHLRLRAEVSEARYDEATVRWHVLTTGSLRVIAKVLAIGTGPLSRPAMPHLPGLERFEGPVFHSSRWRHDVPLANRRIAVVGTGASAIQFVPELQKSVGRMTLYQRTAPWVIPKPDRPVEAALRRLLRVPGYERLARMGVYWNHEVRALGFLGPRKLLEPFEKQSREMLRDQVADPALRAKLTPTFQMGCKRILLSNNYYASLAQPNVEVVTEGISEVRERTIVTTDGAQRPADAIVLGTGFTATEWITPMRVYGRGGAELTQSWKDGVATYLGINVKGFPNLFLLLGPNTALGHNSVVLMIEAQIRYLMSTLRFLKRSAVDAIDVKPEVQDRFDTALHADMRGTVWLSGCKSWYLDENGRNTTLWPGYTFDYFRRTKALDPRRYEHLLATATDGRAAV